MDNIEGKLCPLCKEVGMNNPLKKEVNDPANVLYKCEKFHIFGVKGLDIEVIEPPKDKGRQFPIADL